MTFPTAHALLIGIGTYAYAPHINVPITARDAQQVQSVLADPKRCGYPDNQVTLLHDKTARRADILAALDALADVPPDDTVLLFYCGHGDYGADGNYYFTTHDTQLQGGKVKTGAGISEAELLTKLRAIPAKRLLLIFNACHSGEVSPDLGPDDATTGQIPDADFGSQMLSAGTVDAILSTGEGRIIITACRPGQKSWIGDPTGPSTIFTRSLVEGFKGEGLVAPRGGYVGAYDLYEQTYFGVKAAAEAMGHRQEPELTILRGVGPFPVALFRGASDLGIFPAQQDLPPDTAARTVDPAMSQRLLERRFGINVSGDRNVTIGGSVSDSTIITGSRNTVQTAKGSNIAQASGGGSATVNDHSTHTAFDQRGQYVGGSQANVEGDMHVGGDFTQGTTSEQPTPETVIAQMRHLLVLLQENQNAGLIDAETAIDVEGEIKKATVRAEKDEPDKPGMLDHLTRAVDFVENTAAAAGLIAAIQQTIQAVQQAF